MIGELFEAVSGALEGLEDSQATEATHEQKRENDATVEILIQVSLADGVVAPDERSWLASVLGERFEGARFSRFAGKSLDAGVAMVAESPRPVTDLVGAIKKQVRREALACAAFRLSMADTKLDEKEATYLRQLLGALKMSGQDLQRIYERWRRQALRKQHPGAMARLGRTTLGKQFKKIAVYAAIGFFPVLGIACALGLVRYMWNGTRLYAVECADKEGAALVEEHHLKAVLGGVYGILGTVVYAKNPVEIAVIREDDGKRITYQTVKPEVISKFGFKADRGVWDRHGRWVLLGLVGFVAIGVAKRGDVL